MIRFLGFLWALPLTLLGLIAAAVGKVQYLGTRDFVIEFKALPGGLIFWVFDRTGTCGASGMWGCVAFYQDGADSRVGLHERRHAAQAMVFGVFWPLAYLACGLWAAVDYWRIDWSLHVAARAFYWANALERDARRAELAAFTAPNIAGKGLA